MTDSPFSDVGHESRKHVSGFITNRHRQAIAFDERKPESIESGCWQGVNVVKDKNNLVRRSLNHGLNVLRCPRLIAK